MRSVKPGRGPSFLGGVSSVAAAVFGVIWTIGAASMGAPWFFPLFGVVFIIMGIVQAVYNFKNASGKNRYSAFDIVDSREEPDPLNQPFESFEEPPGTEESGDFRYCPYCGAKLGDGFEFCGKCGKRLPEEP